MARLLILLLAMALGPALPALAQDRATLLADRILVVGGDTLIAEGAVEVFFQGQHLTAARLVFDAANGALSIEGPIRIADANGNLLLADQAELSSDLRTGILTSARLVLEGQVQLSAAEIQRSEGGRMTGLVRVLASSCRVCAGRAPLWEIRARSVLHDAERRQLFFSGAQLRFAGVPVFYLPRLRLPDPSQDRASGFLIPRLTSSSQSGTGIRFPYFLTLGQSRDLTLTPYLTSRAGRALSLRYRQATRSGSFQITGSAAQDRLSDAALRYHLEAQGQFALPLGFTLTGNGILVSDRSYLSDYRLSDSDRLDSRAEIARTRRNEHIAARVIGVQSLRDGEDNATLPVALGDLIFHRRFGGGPLGGQAAITLSAHGHQRPSQDPADADGNGIADGRDLARLSFAADWQRRFGLPGGLVLTTATRVSADYYSVTQDAVYAGRHLRSAVIAAADLRWPLARTGPKGGRHLLEPALQLVLAPAHDPAVPNEDSALVEFDEANLFALGRFPGTDALEAGPRINAGLHYLYLGPGGGSLDLTAGRVLRLADEGQFSDASGLAGSASHWLLALSADSGTGFSLDSRLLLAPNLAPARGDLRLGITRAQGNFALELTAMAADPAEGRASAVRDLALEAGRRLGPNWTASGAARLDLTSAKPVTAAAGLGYLNECLKVDLSISRRFASSTNVTPATDLGLTVELLGFGGGQAGPQAQCRR